MVTTTVSKHRIFKYVGISTIPDHALIVFARDDDYFFGVLHSRVHEVWALLTGTALENRPRYTPSTCFETFPFPWAPGAEPVTDPQVEAIANAARVLVAARDSWLNPPDSTPAELTKRTLTNLYNTQPSWLRDAHATLDAAVCAAYGWPATLADNEIIARLLELNQQRAAHPS
jgi:type II restriction/modification system DNA methylase subunit YeeA